MSKRKNNRDYMHKHGEINPTDQEVKDLLEEGTAPEASAEPEIEPEAPKNDEIHEEPVEISEEEPENEEPENGDSESEEYEDEESVYSDGAEEDEEDEEEEEDELEKKLKRAKRRNLILFIIIIILLLLLGSCSAMYQKKKACCDGCAVQEEDIIEVDPNQGQYASEETIEEHVKMIAMPGWTGFTIPANTTSISQGFEYHNPSSNSWYEDTVTINGIETETFIVGEDEVKIDHLLRIAGIKNTVKSIVSYDESLFKVELGSDNQFFIKGLKGFNGTQEIVVETANGEQTTLSVTSKNDFYYMTFALYIEGNGEDELIYQSGLVEPGMYIQRMEMTRALKSGTYDAYVLCQPYKSDGRTKTNNGIVKLTLKVA